MCSFLNRWGGDIFLGVADDGEILGVPKNAVKDLVRNFNSCLNNETLFNPTTSCAIEEIEIDEKIMGTVDMETGEIIDIEMLDKLQMERDQKIENIACWIKNLESDAEALKAQKQTFADRQKVAENKVASLKKYLSEYLAGEKFSTEKVAISFRKSESVQINDIYAIAEFDSNYLKYEEPKADKTAIKKALKEGVVVPGAELIQGNNIQIK